MAATNCLIGIYYFAGWWRDLPNKYVPAGNDWRTNYPDRRALLGEYNEQATMDREIIAAASNGVSFFQILWYYQGNQQHREPHQEKLNEGLSLFLASTNNSRVKFTIEFVNHPPFAIESDDAWRQACREWCKAMQHPSYLKIDGRPVFKIHGLDWFFQQNKGDSREVARRLEVLREIARQAGVGDPLIGAGVMAGGVTAGLAVQPYDYLTTYMDVPNLPQRERPYPYATLLGLAARAWTNYAQLGDKPYVPYLPAGWDPRPWKDPRPSFELPTRTDWTAALQQLKATLASHPNLGFPTRGNARQPAVLIYAWNEFGEGGFVAPTAGTSAMKLEQIKAVFGPGSFSNN